MSASECLQHPWLSGADIYIGDDVKALRVELYKYILFDMNTVDVEGLFGQLLVHIY